MPELTSPRLDVHFSFVESVQEFHAYGQPPPYVAALDPKTLRDAADFDNVASRNVIEKNGGQQIAPYQDKLRFWVPT